MEKDIAPTGLYNYLPRFGRSTKTRKVGRSKKVRHSTRRRGIIMGGDRTEKLEKLKSAVSLVLSRRSPHAYAGKELLGRAKKLGVTVPSPKSLDALYGSLKVALSSNKK